MDLSWHTSQWAKGTFYRLFLPWQCPGPRLEGSRSQSRQNVRCVLSPYCLTTSRKVSAINSSQSVFLLSLRKMIWQSCQDSPPAVTLNNLSGVFAWSWGEYDDLNINCENFRSPTRLRLYFWPQNWMLDIPENLIWLGDVKIELKFISQALFGFVWLELVPDKQGRRCRILWFHLKNLIRTTFLTETSCQARRLLGL